MVSLWSAHGSGSDEIPAYGQPMVLPSLLGEIPQMRGGRSPKKNTWKVRREILRAFHEEGRALAEGLGAGAPPMKDTRACKGIADFNYFNVEAYEDHVFASSLVCYRGEP